MTYRILEKQLTALFDRIPLSDMDNEVAPEDLVAMAQVISRGQDEGFIY